MEIIKITCTKVYAKYFTFINLFNFYPLYGTYIVLVMKARHEKLRNYPKCTPISSC
jgi:hypothetical protein